MDYYFLVGLIVIFSVYIWWSSQTEKFDNEKPLKEKPRKECSDISINTSILDYQLSPLNQKKIA